jgi:nitroimidazol reductase NimA-like FMN-containing flavoprotein (pyridoxamine 5'-phosphate oxidase superfamily)
MRNDTHDAAGMEALDAAECRRLLASVPIGRVVFTDQAMPAVQPVNFLVHEGAVVFRTGEGSKLAAAARNAVVAFEADEIDREYQRGWSVVVVGHAQEVTDPVLRRRLAELPLRPWAAGAREHVIRIPIDVIYGRRIAPAGLRAVPRNGRPDALRPDGTAG